VAEPFDVRIEVLAAEGRVLPAFAWIGWRWISRNPIAAAVPILLPFFFLFFLRLIAPPEYFPLQVAGAMLFTIQNIGSWCLSDSAYWRIEQRLQDLFVASPLGKIRYLFGVAFSNLIPAAPALVVLAVLLAWVTPVTPAGWAVLLAALVVLWILFSAIGIAISSRLRSQREVWPVGNLIFTLLGILSPLYYPITILPDAWQGAARFLPATYAALLVQGALGLRPAGLEEIALDAALLLGSALLGIVLALALYQWRER
jgi:ABC-2 type transport system permease protein